ncbi:MAG: hypothetical protein ACI9Z4_002456 [Polaribacter sp.]
MVFSTNKLDLTRFFCSNKTKASFLKIRKLALYNFK